MPPVPSGTEADRVLTQSITPEFLDAHGGATREDIKQAAARFERNYNAVVVVRERQENFNGDTGYNIIIITARDADREEVRRGMSSILHWLSS